MSECFTCKNKIEIQKHKHVICKIHNRTRLTVVSCNDYKQVEKPKRVDLLGWVGD